MIRKSSIIITFTFLGILSNAHSETSIHELCLSQNYTESPITVNHPNLPAEPGSEGKISLHLVST